MVSGTNERNKAIILDCFVFHGNSGGPVLQAEWKKVGQKEFGIIGVVTEIIPVSVKHLNPQFKSGDNLHDNSGYAVAIPMDMVFELIGEPPTP